MKKYKNILYIIFLFLILTYGVILIIKYEVSEQVSKIELSLEKKQLIENKKIKEDIINISYNLEQISNLGKINIKSYKLTNNEKLNQEIFKKALSKIDNSICEKIIDNKLKLSCRNSIYYEKALSTLDKNFCNKIKDNDIDKNECNRKVNIGDK